MIDYTVTIDERRRGRCGMANEFFGGLHAPSWRVRCTGCGVSTGWSATEAEAVREWEVLG